MATVPAQAAEVCELGAVQGAPTHNLDVPIQAEERAASAMGRRP